MEREDGSDVEEEEVSAEDSLEPAKHSDVPSEAGEDESAHNGNAESESVPEDPPRDPPTDSAGDIAPEGSVIVAGRVIPGRSKDDSRGWFGIVAVFVGLAAAIVLASSYDDSGNLDLPGTVDCNAPRVRRCHYPSDCILRRVAPCRLDSVHEQYEDVCAVNVTKDCDVPGWDRKIYAACRARLCTAIADPY